VSDEDVAAASADAHKLRLRTETIDNSVVLSGEVWLILLREEVRLGPGDVVVQRRTNHAWSNRSPETTRMLFVLLDGAKARDD
jgi:uncharacterized cupin superfamily protein